jgi:hypothetical protein
MLSATPLRSLSNLQIFVDFDFSVDDSGHVQIPPIGVPVWYT